MKYFLKQFCSPRAGNPENVLLTSRNRQKYFYQCDKTATNLDEDDKELVKLLHGLKSGQQREVSQKGDNSSQASRNSQRIPRQTKLIGSTNSQKSDSSADLSILSQHQSQMSKEKYESEVNETLEMNKILDWAKDDSFDVEKEI